MLCPLCQDGTYGIVRFGQETLRYCLTHAYRRVTGQIVMGNNTLSATRLFGLRARAGSSS